MATGDQSGLFVIWDTLTSRIMFSKQYEEPILSINWNKNNIIAFSHGESVEIMVWKYSKTSKKIAEEIINEAIHAN